MPIDPFRYDDAAVRIPFPQRDENRPKRVLWHEWPGVSSSH